MSQDRGNWPRIARIARIKEARAAMIGKEILWRQFGASIDMLENAMHACPDSLWSDPSRRPEWKPDGVVGFWYLGYHALFYLDLYLSGFWEGFHPPSPFTLDEGDPAGVLPDNPYTKTQLLAYLHHCRAKCGATISALTDADLDRVCTFSWGSMTFAELLLDNMRHVQHHAAQLNLLLRQNTSSAPGWVKSTKQPMREQ
jgi:hypothetical protein